MLFSFAGASINAHHILGRLHPCYAPSITNVGG